ncbi:acyl-CoA dehydrogenase family protein [Nakamurella lactea]|uniref:acyl-CoA dehydrogenase family protein n=1 Tax=Nakamurella lactea TaxID=459515 RepID=UPI00040CC9A5|nr:acyl-CoA dehydrogenase family protein [Nakamurella lactea]
MDRKHFDTEHLDFGDAFRTFIDRSVLPHLDDYQRAGIVAREVFTAAGKGGFLGMAIPEEFGGGGTADFRFNQVLGEQIGRSGIGGAGLGISLHNDICLPYFLHYSTDEQRRRWLPGIASGEQITAIAMSEPGAGSDLAGLRTRARRDGGHYVVNGAKTFITNGINADLVIVACRTGQHDADRRRGLSLLVVERDMPGFERGRNLDKLGLHSQDTAELSFTDVRVPVANLLGEEGQGFDYLSAKLPQERTSIAVAAVAEARAALDETVGYVKGRSAFGRPIGAFQHTKFVLADIATEIDIAQAYLDRCVDRLNTGELSAADAAKAKYFCTELQGRVVDSCLQLYGGYGYMAEYPISRRFADARITRIYGGTSEIMKTVISKSIGL